MNKGISTWKSRTECNLSDKFERRVLEKIRWTGSNHSRGHATTLRAWLFHARLLPGFFAQILRPQQALRTKHRRRP